MTKSEDMSFASSVIAEPVNAEILAKVNISDGIFTNLFKIPEYTFQLYRALHPEDDELTGDEIRIVTLENILLNQPYNDLGFMAGKRFLILCEAQSTWSANILLRIFIYLAQTIQNYITESGQNVYSSKKIEFPEPEFYVIYTGDRRMKPEWLTLTDEFFKGREAAVNIRVKMIYDGEEGDIINQYVTFTRIYKEQYTLYGRSRKAVLKTLRICENENVLKEYLASRKKEVVDIMMTLFDKEFLLGAYIKEMKDEGRQEGIQTGIETGIQAGIQTGRQEGKRETALNLADMGLTPEMIAQATMVSLETVRQWLESTGDSVK